MRGLNFCDSAEEPFECTSCAIQAGCAHYMEASRRGWNPSSRIPEKTSKASHREAIIGRKLLAYKEERRVSFI